MDESSWVVRATGLYRDVAQQCEDLQNHFANFPLPRNEARSISETCAWMGKQLAGLEAPSLSRYNERIKNDPYYLIDDCKYVIDILEGVSEDVECMRRFYEERPHLLNGGYHSFSTWEEAKKCSFTHFNDDRKRCKEARKEKAKAKDRESKRRAAREAADEPLPWRRAVSATAEDAPMDLEEQRRLESLLDGMD